MSGHLARGLRLLELQRYSEAAREFVKSAAHSDSPAHSLALAADSLLAAGDVSGARELLQQARQLDPNEHAVLFTGSKLCMRDGLGDEARSLFAQILHDRPECPDLLSAAARMELTLNNRPAALRYAEAGLAINPTHEECLETMVHLLGTTPEAIDYARRLLAASPENAEAHRALASFACDEDQLAEASAHAREAARLEPNSADSLERLAATSAHRHPVFQFLVEGRLGRHHLPATMRVLCFFIPTLLWFVVTLALSVYLGEKTLADLAPWTTWIDRCFRPQSLAAAWLISLIGWQAAYTLFCAVFIRSFRLLLHDRRGYLLTASSFSATSIGSLLAYIVTGDWAFYGSSFLAIFSIVILGAVFGAHSFSRAKCMLAVSTVTLAGLVAAVLGHYHDFPSGVVIWSLVLVDITAFLVLKPRRAPTTIHPPIPSS
ncbi:MAG: tetratricopeptide repeat protein [Rariglobus sp.]|nr:tetratricopeptide repeat protein [Rariglobus sp.]